jgi:RHS repeat-associated protein
MSLYGVTRIGEQQPGGWAYHLSDALGSVRQLADDAAQVTLARGYMPYGEPLWSVGAGQSAYGYTGEDWNTTTQLVFLRARYMQPGLGMFLSRDPWDGDELQPLTYNGWLYVEGNPVKYRDPSGLIKEGSGPGSEAQAAENIVNELKPYGITIVKDWGILNEPRSGCKIWQEGAWSLSDLAKVNTAIHKFDDARFFGGAARFSRAIQGHAKIVRANRDDITAVAPPPAYRFAFEDSDVYLSNRIFRDNPQPEYAIFTVIHELGHVWDFRTGNALSKELMGALGTWQWDRKKGWYWDR